MHKFLIALVFVLVIFTSTILCGRLQAATTFVGSSVLDEVPLIDGYLNVVDIYSFGVTFWFIQTYRHNDLPYSLYELEQNILSNFTFNSDLRLIPKWAASPSSHTDLPRLRQGKVGGQVRRLPGLLILSYARYETDILLIDIKV